MKRSFAIIIVFITLSLVGCALLPLLPIKKVPSRNMPSITVSFSMYGNSARTVESEVTSRIESVLARVKGVTGISSQSNNGSGSVTISLDRHTDIQMARFEISTMIRQIWDDLPDGTGYPEIGVRPVDNDAIMPMLSFSINADANANDIKAIAEDMLATKLSTIKGVGRVIVSGGNPLEWQLEYDIDRLDAAHITPNDIRQAISRHYATRFYGIGQVISQADTSWMRIVSTPAGDMTAPPDLRHITVTSQDGTLTTLDRLVTMKRQESSPTGYYRINGLNSVYMRIYAEDNVNQLSLANDIRTLLPGLVKKLPPGYTVECNHDVTESIRGELDKIYFRTALTLLILLLFIALVTLNLLTYCW